MESELSFHQVQRCVGLNGQKNILVGVILVYHLMRKMQNDAQMWNRHIFPLAFLRFSHSFSSVDSAYLKINFSLLFQLLTRGFTEENRLMRRISFLVFSLLFGDQYSAQVDQYQMEMRCLLKWKRLEHNIYDVYHYFHHKLKYFLQKKKFIYEVLSYTSNIFYVLLSMIL